jgi:hypothetical protein
MKNKRITTLLAVAMSLTAIGCAEAAPSQAVNRYPEAERQSFLEGCSGETALATCECMLNQIEQTIPLDELLELQALGDAVLEDDRVIAAVTACVN